MVGTIEEATRRPRSSPPKLPDLGKPVTTGRHRSQRPTTRLAFREAMKRKAENGQRLLELEVPGVSSFRGSRAGDGARRRG